MAKAITRMREIERKLDFGTVGQSKWTLIRAADEAQAVLDAVRRNNRPKAKAGSRA